MSDCGACNYQPDAVYLENVIHLVRRLPDACACNYDATATFDNNTCDFESCLGCIYREPSTTMTQPLKTTAVFV